MSFSVCFTGHRPASLPFKYNESDSRCVALKQQLYSQIELMITQFGATRFYTGMALGVDIWAAEAVLQLRHKYPWIMLECAVPCRTQADSWQQSSRKRYHHILDVADDVVVLSESFTDDCMHARNRYMVDHANTVIAVWNGNSRTGTGSTVNYAKKHGKSVVRIDPEQL